MVDTIFRTIVPIFLLIGTGFLSRRLGVLKSGDERVLSAYVYYFALPALFLVTMDEVVFTSEILLFISAGMAPILAPVTAYTALYLLLRFTKTTLYLLILSTCFGSYAFFGIPFITFAFPAEGERLATLAAASISIVSVTISLTILELYRLKEPSKLQGLKSVAKSFSKNPLIISIFSGTLLSLAGIRLPIPLSTSLHLLGGTTSAVAIFMLGVFLYGRRYTNLASAFKLSLLRIIFLPVIALLIARTVGLTGVEGSVLVLMHGMPVAISMIVLSERYDFCKETIATLILVSSVGAAVYLNMWLLLLGQY